MKKDPRIDIHKERDLLDDLWMHMKGDKYANIDNLKTFLYGIWGLKYPWMIEAQENENSKVSLVLVIQWLSGIIGAYSCMNWWSVPTKLIKVFPL